MELSNEKIEKAAETAWETARVQPGWMGICSTWAEVEEPFKDQWRALCRAVQPILAPTPASVPGDLVERCQHTNKTTHRDTRDIWICLECGVNQNGEQWEPDKRATAALRIAQADHEAELQALREELCKYLDAEIGLNLRPHMMNGIMEIIEECGRKAV